ncbi:MAG TPA: FHA domain-containing protein [Vicinamibacteria bacterium]|nr:FHA domain-containing protein [Vicinamibacteria bacterium]
MDLKELITGLRGGEGELGHPDLLRKVVDGILKLRRHGDRGMEFLPPEVEVRIGVAEGGLQVLQRWVNDPAFDREVEAALKNRLVRTHDDALPVRRYVVEASPHSTVVVKERQPRGFQLRVESGDRAGTVFPLPADRRDLLLGRSAWHGDDQQVANDIVISENERAVSRRAARLHRTGASFELQSLDQREALSVLRPDGTRLRPALSASGRVPVKPGDLIEFTDGAKPVAVLKLEETET